MEARKRTGTHDGRPPRRRIERRGGPALTQAERSNLAESRMVSAALDLMAQQGYEAATLAAIGEAAGYSRGLATHHFGSKDALFAQVLRSVTEEFRALVATKAAGRSGVDALVAFVDAHRELSEREPQKQRAFLVLAFQSLIAQSNLQETAVDNLLGHRDWARRMIERGIAEGTVRADADASLEAVEFCGTIFGLTLQWAIDPAGSPLAATHARYGAKLRADLAPR